MKKSSHLFSIFFLLFTTLNLVILAGTQQSEMQLRNIKAFTKVYGYVRFFHPSDEAASLDWNKFAIYGVEKVKNAKNDEELKEVLKQLFLPIAPTAQIYSSKEKLKDISDFFPKDTTGLKVVFWQHFGVGLSSDPYLYRSIRINKENVVPKNYQQNKFGTVTQFIDAQKYRGKEIKLSAFTKTKVDKDGQGQLWLRVDRGNKQLGFFDNMDDRPMKNSTWKEFEIKGKINDDAKQIVFGCFLLGYGNLWVDKLQLSFLDNDGKWKEIPIQNNDFEEADENNLPKYWLNKSSEYTFKIVADEKYEGKSSLHILCEIKKEIVKKKIFAKVPHIGESINKKVVDGIYCSIPLALYSDEKHTIGFNPKYPFESLSTSLGEFDQGSNNANDENVRLANVVISWNVFQHFYPYFDVVKVDWNNVLDETLLESFLNRTADEFYKTLSKMVAKLEDGHGYVYYKPEKPVGGLPFRADFIEGKIVITATSDSSKFPKGDVILTIDGKSGLEELLEEEKYVSGSPQLKRYRTLNQFGAGENGSIARLELLRDNAIIPLEYKREIDTRGFFFNQISEFDFPAIKKLEDNIYYINLSSTSEKEFLDSINVFANAKGVIFDTRWNGKYNKDLKRIDQKNLLRYLAKEPFQSAFWNVPQIIYPDRVNISFSESRWPLVAPKTPHFNGTLVYIVDPPVVSYGESILGIVEHYKMAEIVGGLTAGTNGDVNFINLVGGYRIMWTGMKVIKHDGSQHHLIGIKPTYPVTRTIRAVKEGKDEYLEKAIEVIKSKI